MSFTVLKHIGIVSIKRGTASGYYDINDDTREFYTVTNGDAVRYRVSRWFPMKVCKDSKQYIVQHLYNVQSNYGWCLCQLAR